MRIWHGNTTRFFLSDYVKGWGCTFEINEFQVNRWLRSVGADMMEMDMTEILDGAKTQFERFHHFYERAIDELAPRKKNNK